MSIRKYISFVLFVLGSIVSNAQQIDTDTLYHRLISTAGGDSTFLPAGETNPLKSVNISWTIGEVVVFNADTLAPKLAGFSIAQSMQSYPPFKIECPDVTIKSNNVNLCEGLKAFGTELSYEVDLGMLQASKPDLLSIQWYYSNNNLSFSKIAGATDINQTEYQPFFEGSYKVSIKFKGLSSCDADSFSKNSVTIQNLSTTFTAPQIIPTGSPVSMLTAVPSAGYDKVQWYVYFEPLNKYLLIAGGSKLSQKIRYKGTYMVIANYQGGCRLSSTFSIDDNLPKMLRASDFKIEGNTIYIPDEEAPENSALSVYPNPTLGDFVVRFQSTDEITANAQLYSNTGVFVKEIVFTEGSAWSKQAKVETDDLSAGVYFLKVNQDNKHLVQKVVIYK